MSLDFTLYEKLERSDRTDDLFSGNYTHNVVPMWREAGIYDALYESHGRQAKDILEILRKGLADMQDNPSKYIKLNPKNGWGDYHGAMEFLSEIIKSCAQYPDAKIYISK